MHFARCTYCCLVQLYKTFLGCVRLRTSSVVINWMDVSTRNVSRSLFRRVFFPWISGWLFLQVYRMLPDMRAHIQEDCAGTHNYNLYTHMHAFACRCIANFKIPAYTYMHMQSHLSHHCMFAYIWADHEMYTWAYAYTYAYAYISYT